MTAEVAVLNKSAVALAADSKVTVGSSGSEKTYDTVNKIFTLSKVHPVGIMIYGSADFMEYPWETIVKLYRSSKKARSEQTVRNWGDDFWTFVRKFGPVREREKLRNVRGVLESIFQGLEEGAMYFAHLRNTLGAEQIQEIFVELMNREISNAYSMQRWATKKQGLAIVNKFSKIILELASAFPKKSAAHDKALELSVASLLNHVYSSQHSGVVIAGFGDRDVFPSLAHYVCDGYIGDRIKFLRTDYEEIKMQNRSMVSAFAQGDIVERFMEGIDPRYANVLRGLFSTALIESNIKTFEKWAPKGKVTNKIRNQIVKAVNAQYERILNSALQYRTDEFIKPTTDMVALLPKDELAQLAESLVALTSLHRRVSREVETVGGAVDVAVISKSDGFVWIKRKHYFRPELNPQFSTNYMRDVQGGQR